MTDDADAVRTGLVGVARPRPRGAAPRVAGLRARRLRHRRRDRARALPAGPRPRAQAGPVVRDRRGPGDRARDPVAHPRPLARTTGWWARSTATEAGRSTTRWYIDPIDGTHNFIRGVPLFGTLLGGGARRRAAGRRDLGARDARALVRVARRRGVERRARTASGRSASRGWRRSTTPSSSTGRPRDNVASGLMPGFDALIDACVARPRLRRLLGLRAGRRGRRRGDDGDRDAHRGTSRRRRSSSRRPAAGSPTSTASAGSTPSRSWAPTGCSTTRSCAGCAPRGSDRDQVARRNVASVQQTAPIATAARIAEPAAWSLAIPRAIGGRHPDDGDRAEEELPQAADARQQGGAGRRRRASAARPVGAPSAPRRGRARWVAGDGSASSRRPAAGPAARDPVPTAPGRRRGRGGPPPPPPPPRRRWPRPARPDRRPARSRAASARRCPPGTRRPGAGTARSGRCRVPRPAGRLGRPPRRRPRASRPAGHDRPRAAQGDAVQPIRRDPVDRLEHDLDPLAGRGLAGDREPVGLDHRCRGPREQQADGAQRDRRGPPRRSGSRPRCPPPSTAGIPNSAIAPNRMIRRPRSPGSGASGSMPTARSWSSKLVSGPASIASAASIAPADSTGLGGRARASMADRIRSRVPSVSSRRRRHAGHAHGDHGRRTRSASARCAPSPGSSGDRAVRLPRRPAPRPGSRWPGRPRRPS